jgi:hypothetical protein
LSVVREQRRTKSEQRSAPNSGLTADARFGEYQPSARLEIVDVVTVVDVGFVADASENRVWAIEVVHAAVGVDPMNARSNSAGLT